MYVEYSTMGRYAASHELPAADTFRSSVGSDRPGRQMKLKRILLRCGLDFGR